MKSLKKSLAVVLSLVIVLSMLTGCMYERFDITFNPNGSGTVKMIVGVEKEALETLAAMGGDMTGLEEEDLVERVINNKVYLVAEEEDTFSSVEEFNRLINESAEDGEVSQLILNVTRNSDTDFIFSMTANLPEGEEIIDTSDTDSVDFALSQLPFDVSELGLGEEELAALVESMVMEMVFIFPTQMEMVTGSDDVFKVEGNKVILNLLATPDISGNHFEYVARSVNGNSSKEPGKVVAFVDVSPNAWYYNSVMKAVDLGLFNGTKAPDENGIGTFEPEKTITRAEFITTMIRAIGESPVDVKGSYWYDGYIQKAIEKEIITSTDFGGDYNVPMTREEMAYVMNRTAQTIGLRMHESQEARNSIPDWYSIKEEYKNSVLKCYNEGILMGVDAAGTFNPGGLLTRGQAATVILRLLEKDNTI